MPKTKKSKKVPGPDASTEELSWDGSSSETECLVSSPERVFPVSQQNSDPLAVDPNEAARLELLGFLTGASGSDSDETAEDEQGKSKRKKLAIDDEENDNAVHSRTEIGPLRTLYDQQMAGTNSSSTKEEDDLESEHDAEETNRKAKKRKNVSSEDSDSDSSLDSDSGKSRTKKRTKILADEGGSAKKSRRFRRIIPPSSDEDSDSDPEIISVTSSDESSDSDIEVVEENGPKGRKNIREIVDETHLQAMSRSVLYDLTFLSLTIIFSNSGGDKSCGKGRRGKEATYSRKTETVQ